MKVLLTGANGQLGRCFQDRAPKGMELIVLTRGQLDIANQANVIALCDKLKPDLIVNAAAYTAVDKAESEPEIARATNTIGPENLAYAAVKLNIPIIHVSTDYVFDGTASTPYTTTCPTNPQSVYGQTKLDGEKSIKAITAKHIIIRTAWVFSEYGTNFVKTMLKLGLERDELNIVGDQYGTPTYAGDLADFIIKIIDKNMMNYGTFHFNGGTTCSWYCFAEEIFKTNKEINKSYSVPKLNSIHSSDFPTAAKRPYYSVLDDSKSHQLFNYETLGWKCSLVNVINKLI